MRGCRFTGDSYNVALSSLQSGVNADLSFYIFEVTQGCKVSGFASFNSSNKEL